VAINSGMDVKVDEPHAYPLQLQGPKSKDVMRALVGDAVLDIKYYWTVWVPVALANAANQLEIEGPDGDRVAGHTARIPFIDPKKRTPVV
jgi:glycine cleavage system aminomethyltransferase T